MIIDTEDFCKNLIKKTIYKTWENIPSEYKVKKIIEEFYPTLYSLCTQKNLSNLSEILTIPCREYTFEISSLLNIIRNSNPHNLITFGVFSDIRYLNYFLVNHNLLNHESFFGLDNAYNVLSYIKVNSYNNFDFQSFVSRNSDIKRQVREDIKNILESVYEFILLNPTFIEQDKISRLLYLKELSQDSFVAPLLSLHEYLYYYEISLIPRGKLTKKTKSILENDLFYMIF